jgi:hypothetical protein
MEIMAIFLVLFLVWYFGGIAYAAYKEIKGEGLNNPPYGNWEDQNWSKYE